MNNRIKQLSDQAYNNHLLNNPHSSFAPRQDYVKQFSDLLIKECIDIIEERKQVFNESDQKWNQARIQNSNQIIEDIKKLLTD